MNFNFELILFYITLFCGVVALFDVIFLARKRKANHRKMPLIIEYARSFFPVLLLVFLFRSFVFEPFRIPSGSLKPTLDIGDFILVNKFDYGVRLPVVHTQLMNTHDPKRGDIIVFRWPPNPSVDFIKRVVGVPGDNISYIDKILYINGEKTAQTFLHDATDEDESNKWTVKQKQENLLGVMHDIYQNPNLPSEDFRDLVVPENMYFAMGDNRDNSADSRFWGFVPKKNIVGKASFVWMSWDSSKHWIRTNRIGKQIQ